MLKVTHIHQMRSISFIVCHILQAVIRLAFVQGVLGPGYDREFYATLDMSFVYLTIRPAALEGKGSNCFSITQLVGQTKTIIKLENAS